MSINRARGDRLALHRSVVAAAIVMSALTLLLNGTAAAAVAAPRVEKALEQVVATDASTFRLNGISFQQDAITSLNGWQYVAFYSDVAGRPGVRHLNIARRKMDVFVYGGWQRLEFTDYEQTLDDSHNVVSMGISPRDGTIHLAFDMHACHPGNTLHYRRSVPGLATDPQDVAWQASSFGAVTNRLGNVTMPAVGTFCGANSPSLSPITYPRFVATPQGDVLLSMRVGVPGNGHEHLWSYANGTWTQLGRYIDGSGANPYLNGLDYDRNGRLHVTWIWREEPALTTSHDINYIYSDDNGRTWKNNSGAAAGTSGSAPVTKSSVGPPAVPIAQNSGLLNQEAQAVDAAGRVHLMMRDNISGSLRWVHWVRGVTDGRWNRRVTPFNPGGRAKIVAARKAGTPYDDVYALLPGTGIASASGEDSWRNWTVVDTDYARFGSEAVYDRRRLADSGLLSLMGQTGTTLVTQEWRLAR